MNIGQRIEKLLQAKNGGNMSELARFCSVTPQAAQQWITGQTVPRGTRLKKIAEFLGVPESALVYGDIEQVIQHLLSASLVYKPDQGSGTALISSMDFAAEKEHNPDRRGDAPGRRDVDLMAHHSDGGIVILELKATGGSMGTGLLLRDQPGEIQHWNVTPEWITKNVKNHTGTQNLRIVTGFGDSMRPLYNPGDPLLVDSGVRSVDFDSIYFFRIGDEGFIKRLQRVPGQGLLAISENKSYRDWVITPDMDFQVFARVIKVWCGSEF